MVRHSNSTDVCEGKEQQALLQPGLHIPQTGAHDAQHTQHAFFSSWAPLLRTSEVFYISSGSSFQRKPVSPLEVILLS